MGFDMLVAEKHYSYLIDCLTATYNNCLPHWKDIRTYLAPRSAYFNNESDNDGRQNDQELVSSNILHVRRTAARGMHTLMSSSSMRWFQFGYDDKQLADFQPVKEWLYNSGEVVRTIISGSNIYNKLEPHYLTQMDYGTSVLMLEDDDADIIRAYSLAFGTFMIGTDAAARVDTLLRMVQLNSYQFVMKFKDKTPAVVKRRYDEGDYKTKYTVYHIIEPNRNYKKGSKLSQDKKWASVWIWKDKLGQKEGFLSIKGYDLKPFMCSRMHVTGDDVWAYGCGSVALSDNKASNLLDKRIYQGISQQVRPTMLADSGLQNAFLSTDANDTVYVNGLLTGANPYRKAFEINPDFRMAVDKVNLLEERVRSAYFVPLLTTMLDIANRPALTAAQTLATQDEKLSMLTPLAESTAFDLHSPMIDFIFQSAWLRGKIAKPPKELEGKPLMVEFISTLAQAQKSKSVANVERFLELVETRVMPVYPDAIDKLNLDETIEEFADSLAISPQNIHADDVTAQIRQARQQAQAEAAQQQKSMMDAERNRTLSQTDTSGENALTSGGNYAA